MGWIKPHKTLQIQAEGIQDSKVQLRESNLHTYLRHFMCVSVCRCVCTACAYVSFYIHTGIFNTYIHLE